MIIFKELKAKANIILIIAVDGAMCLETFLGFVLVKSGRQADQRLRESTKQRFEKKEETDNGEVFGK